MRRRLLLAAALFLAVLLPAAPASAITNGAADGTATRTSAARGADAVLRRHLDLLLRHADLPDGLPHRRALRRGRPGPGHVRSRLPGRRQGLLRHLPRRPALPGPHERRPRHRRRRPGQGRQGHHPGHAAPAPTRCPVCRRHAAVHLGRLRRLRGDQPPRWPPVPLRRRPHGRDRHAELDQQDLAADLDEPLHRQRRHLLRRLRRSELPRDDAASSARSRSPATRLPVDQRRLPAGHRDGPGVPRPVRDRCRRTLVRQVSTCLW